jgi:hypothetical protein
VRHADCAQCRAAGPACHGRRRAGLRAPPVAVASRRHGAAGPGRPTAAANGPPRGRPAAAWGRGDARAASERFGRGRLCPNPTQRTLPRCRSPASRLRISRRTADKAVKRSPVRSNGQPVGVRPLPPPPDRMLAWLRWRGRLAAQQ